MYIYIYIYIYIQLLNTFIININLIYNIILNVYLYETYVGESNLKRTL